MRRAVILLIACLLLPGSVWAQGAAGVIAGTVTMEGAELPGGLEAELLFLPNGQGPPQITAQPLSADGAFRFEGLDTAPEHSYLVRVVYEGQEVYSDIQAFSQGQSELQTSVILTPVTSNTSTLTIPQISYLLDARPEGWIVAGLLSFQNTGDATIVNTEQPPVRVVVPEEAFELDVPVPNPTQPLSIQEEVDGFSFAGPIRPGESQLIYSFLLPYTEGSQSITLPRGLAVDTVRVLVPDLGQQTQSGDLVQLPTSETLETRVFAVWQTENVAPDGSISLSFENLPPPPDPVEPLPDDTTGNTGTPLAPPRVEPISPLETLPWWAVLVPAALLLGGVVGYLVARPSPSAAETTASLRTRREQLVAEIAALDIRYEVGAIGEQTHQRQREVLKRELKQVLRRLDGETVPEVAG